MARCTRCWLNYELRLYQITYGSLDFGLTNCDELFAINKSEIYNYGLFLLRWKREQVVPLNKDVRVFLIVVN